MKIKHIFILLFSLTFIFIGCENEVQPTERVQEEIPDEVWLSLTGQDIGRSIAIEKGDMLSTCDKCEKQYFGVYCKLCYPCGKCDHIDEDSHCPYCWSYRHEQKWVEDHKAKPKSKVEYMGTQRYGQDMRFVNGYDEVV